MAYNIIIIIMKSATLSRCIIFNNNVGQGAWLGHVSAEAVRQAAGARGPGVARAVRGAVAGVRAGLAAVRGHEAGVGAEQRLASHHRAPAAALHSLLLILGFFSGLEFADSVVQYKEEHDGE